MVYKITMAEPPYHLRRQMHGVISRMVSFQSADWYLKPETKTQLCKNKNSMKYGGSTYRNVNLHGMSFGRIQQQTKQSIAFPSWRHALPIFPVLCIQSRTAQSVWMPFRGKEHLPFSFAAAGVFEAAKSYCRVRCRRRKLPEASVYSNGSV